MFEPGDLVVYCGKVCKLASQEEVMKYWGYCNTEPDRVWGFFNGPDDSPTHTDMDSVTLHKKFKKKVRRTLPDWF